MPIFPDVLDELTAYVRSRIPLAAPSAGVFNLLTSVQASQRSFVEEVKAATITLPCVVIQIGDDEPDTEFGVSSDLRRYPIALHLLQAWGPLGTQRTLHAALKSLRQGLESPVTPFTNFFVVERGTVRTGTENPVSKELFVDADATIIAGTLEYVPGIQVDDA